MRNTAFGITTFYQMAKLIFVVCVIAAFVFSIFSLKEEKKVLSESADVDFSYWMVLHRKSNKEFLYLGEPGDLEKSVLVKAFKVKTGIEGRRPTPLPSLVGRDYWIIVDKRESFENAETAPYFLQLDIPVSANEPFGPEPYLECGGQCSWVLPGYFGLHGVNGEVKKLSDADLGSSGCVRHYDQDIVYLYNTLNPLEGEIRYYVEDI